MLDVIGYVAQDTRDMAMTKIIIFFKFSVSITASNLALALKLASASET